jgi:hypothetical protein
VGSATLHSPHTTLGFALQVWVPPGNWYDVTFGQLIENSPTGTGSWIARDWVWNTCARVHASPCQNLLYQLRAWDTLPQYFGLKCVIVVSGLTMKRKRVLTCVLFNPYLAFFKRCFLLRRMLKRFRGLSEGVP